MAFERIKQAFSKRPDIDERFIHYALRQKLADKDSATIEGSKGNKTLILHISRTDIYTIQALLYEGRDLEKRIIIRPYPQYGQGSPNAVKELSNIAKANPDTWKHIMKKVIDYAERRPPRLSEANVSSAVQTTEILSAAVQQINTMLNKPQPTKEEQELIRRLHEGITNQNARMRWYEYRRPGKESLAYLALDLWSNHGTDSIMLPLPKYDLKRAVDLIVLHQATPAILAICSDIRKQLAPKPVARVKKGGIGLTSSR